MVHGSSTTSLHTAIALMLPVLAWCSLMRLATGVPHGRPAPMAAAHLTVEVQPQGLVAHVSMTSLGTDKSSVVEISARGDVVRREETVATGASLAQVIPVGGMDGFATEAKAGSGEPEDIKQDGKVLVVAPVTSQSEKLQLTDLNEECMHVEEQPTAECMEKFGSYGIRKMFTESWKNLQKLEYLRPGWMSHPEVQKRKLFDLTLPGTVSSGSYVITGEDAIAAGSHPYGVVSQNLDFYQQLQLGVRLFDIKVAYSAEAKLVYISHGALMIPLEKALKDMRKFLEQHEREVIVLDVHKDENADKLHLTPLVEEEASIARIPGQLVHEVVACEMKDMLVNYKTLSELAEGGNEFAGNPTIGALTDVGARVVYFWNSQQVLCTNFTDCLKTPGWRPPSREAGFLFAFGPPFEIGKRKNITGGNLPAMVVEPACHTHSSFFTKDEKAEHLMSKLKHFADNMTDLTLEHRPSCYPVGIPLPDIHSPTLWYTMDAFVTPSEEEQAAQADRMRGVKAIYTRGEGFTVRTEAERTSYLLLNWFLKINNSEQFTRPNGIMMEFAGAGAASIIRIIEARQSRPECGFAIYCKDSGSCWADTLLSKEDECLAEADVLQKLMDHANPVVEATGFMGHTSEENTHIVLCVIVILILLGCFAACAGYLWKMFEAKLDGKEIGKPLLDEDGNVQAVFDKDDNVSEADSVPSEPMDPAERPEGAPQMVWRRPEPGAALELVAKDASENSDDEYR